MGLRVTVTERYAEVRVLHPVFSSVLSTHRQYLVPTEVFIVLNSDRNLLFTLKVSVYISLICKGHHE